MGSLVLVISCGRTSPEGESAPWKVGSTPVSKPDNNGDNPNGPGPNQPGSSPSDEASGGPENSGDVRSTSDETDEEPSEQEQTGSSESEQDEKQESRPREITDDSGDAGPIDVSPISISGQPERDIVKSPDDGELDGANPPVKTEIRLKNETQNPVYINTRACTNADKPFWIVLRTPGPLPENPADSCDIENCETDQPGQPCAEETCSDSSDVVNPGLSAGWTWRGFLYDQSNVSFSGGCERRITPDIGDRIVATVCWTQNQQIQADLYCDNIAFQYGDKEVVRTIENPR